MSTLIYKQGQGYWVRMMSAIAYGLLVRMGGGWVWGLVGTIKIGELESVWISMVGVLIFVGVFGVLGLVLIGRKPKVVDFMIATEGEMKKVNWSTRKEIVGSTWVVIGLTAFTAVLIFVIDWLFAWFFQTVGVLEPV